MTISAGQGRSASADMLLRARASMARRMVRQGDMDGELALSLAVWPSAALVEREAKVGLGTLSGRAFGRRGNE